jgi:hypothetical protein
MCVMNVCDECVLLQASRSALARNLSQQYGEMTVKLKQGENRESALLRKNKKLKERLTKLAAEHAALTEQLTDHHVKTGLKQQELDELYLHKSRETSMLSEIALLKTQLEQRNRDQERWTQELAKLRTLQARLVEEAGMSARQVEEYRSRLQQQGAQRTDYSDSQLTSERERRMAAEREVSQLRSQLRGAHREPGGGEGIERELRKEVDYWKQKAVVALESGNMLHANRTSAEESMTSHNAELQRRLRELQQSNDAWRGQLVEKLNLQLAVERKKIDGHVLRLNAQFAQKELQLVQGDLSSSEALPFEQLHIEDVKAPMLNSIRVPDSAFDSNFLPSASSSAAAAHTHSPAHTSRSPFTHPNGLLRQGDGLGFMHLSPSAGSSNAFFPSSSSSARTGARARDPLPSRSQQQQPQPQQQHHHQHPPSSSSASGLRTPPQRTNRSRQSDSSSHYARPVTASSFGQSTRGSRGAGVGSSISPDGKMKLQQSHRIVHDLLGIRGEINAADREQAELEARLNRINQ